MLYWYMYNQYIAVAVKEINLYNYTRPIFKVTKQTNTEVHK